MLEHTLERSGESAVLSLSGELSLENIVEFRKVLLDGLGGSKSVIIHLLKVDTVDMAVLQLLCSAHRMALSTGKSLCISGYPEPFREAVKEAGLTSFACGNDIWRQVCLWPSKDGMPAECR